MAESGYREMPANSSEQRSALRKSLGTRLLGNKFLLDLETPRIDRFVVGDASGFYFPLDRLGKAIVQFQSVAKVIVIGQGQAVFGLKSENLSSMR